MATLCLAMALGFFGVNSLSVGRLVKPSPAWATAAALMMSGSVLLMMSQQYIPEFIYFQF